MSTRGEYKKKKEKKERKKQKKKKKKNDPEKRVLLKVWFNHVPHI